MQSSIRPSTPHWNQAAVSADFPAEIHEQDPDIEIIRETPHTPPQRAFLVPALELIEPLIVEELEDLVASRL
jgi:hypothetical protein